MARRKRYRRKRSFGEILKLTLIAAVIIVPASLIGSKLWIEHEISTFLDETARTIAPFGELRYLGVSVWFDGSVTIKNLSFYPPASSPAPPLITSSASTQTPGYLYLLGVGRQGMPKRLRLDVRGVRMDLGLGASSISGNPIEALGCSEEQVFDSGQLAAMGIAPLGNLVISYDMDTDNDMVSVDFQQTIADAASQEFSMRFSVSGLRALISGGRERLQVTPEVRLQNATLKLEAEDFIAKRNAYCAELEGISADAEAMQNVNAMVEILAEKRLRPNKILGDHYARFVRRGSEWTLTVQPDGGVDLAEFSDPDLNVRKLVETLNVRSQLGGSLSEPVRLDRARVPQLAFTKEAGDGKKVPPNVPLKWQALPQSELRADPNLLVQINTVSGQSYYGYIEETEEASVVILGEVHGGEAKVPIQREQISNVRALLPSPEEES